MEAQPLPKHHVSGSNVTGTSSAAFIETLEHKRFIEFCDACRQYRYIGLCFGAPGIGKTLSAIHYSRVQVIPQLDLWHPVGVAPPLDTVFYTPSVVNTPGRIDIEIRSARQTLLGISTRPLRAEARAVLDRLRQRDEDWRRDHGDDPANRGSRFPPFEPTYFKVFQDYEARKQAATDPTTLIVIDEADRLGMTSLEQVRSIFDKSEVGMVLIGMPGIEKRMARFPQFYSRIGFVHEFRALAADEVNSLLGRGWAPAGVNLPEAPLSPEVLAAIIRMTGGNFRLLNRLLTQIERVLKINDAHAVSLDVVDAARESLVIGQV
jgi:hypothetical protein